MTISEKCVSVQRQVLVYTVISIKAGKLAGPMSASQEELCSIGLVYISHYQHLPIRITSKEITCRGASFQRGKCMTISD